MSYPANQPLAQRLARARYEQSDPAKSRSGDNPSASSGSVMEPTHDAGSVLSAAGTTYSYDSGRDIARYFREINGRRFNSQAATYLLPAGRVPRAFCCLRSSLAFADEEEFWRLDRQHAAFLVGMGDLYPCPDLVERILEPDPGRQKRLLDLGCGTAVWALAMARRFPEASVIALDIAPTPIPVEGVPPNIQFELDDVNFGLDQFHGQMDIVHMRCLGAGLPKYADGITYAARCLRPGGLLLVVDIDLEFCAEDIVSGQKLWTPEQPDGSWLQRYFYEFRWANALNGTDIFEAEEMLDKGIFDHELLEACGAGSVFLPIGPWANGLATNADDAQRLQFGGILARQSLQHALPAFETLMRKTGITDEFLKESTSKANAELDTLSVHSWLRLRMLWGARKSDDPEAAPAPRTQWQPHPQIHIYHTAEESYAARQKRQETMGAKPTPQCLLNDEDEGK